eukprot:4520335-Pyramimonas_sp.AAC.1
MTRNGCCTDVYIILACVPKLGGILGSAWDFLGPLLGPPGAVSWGSPEVLLRPSWGFLELLWGVLGPSEGPMMSPIRPQSEMRPHLALWPY